MSSGRGQATAALPPYRLQSLIDVVGPEFVASNPPIRVQCAEALGNEIYVGCSNGDLLRFALQPSTNPSSPDFYDLLSRQSVPNNRPIDDIILIPSLSRAIVLSDRQVLVYTLPALDMIPSTAYKPIRNVVSIAIDVQQLRQLSSRSGSPPAQPTPVSFCVIKRQSVSVYHLREKPIFEKDIPLPSRIQLAKRSGQYLCVADHENYNMIDISTASLFPILPISQALPETTSPEARPAAAVKPFVVVVADSEFLILSWTGASTLGLFITGEGDPVRGTLQWSSHPISVAFDNPHVTTLLADGTIEVHNIETQALVQTVPPPSAVPTPTIPVPSDRKALLSCPAGFLVPSSERQSKLRLTPVKLRRPDAEPPSVLEAAPESTSLEEQEQNAAAAVDGSEGGGEVESSGAPVVREEEPTPYEL